MEKNDVTVIGAGFAGLACARSCAAQGMKTSVLERKSCPGAKIRTTGILVKEAADLLKLPQHLCKEINKPAVVDGFCSFLGLLPGAEVVA